METQLLIAALKAQMFVLRAECDARAGYTMNRDFQLEVSVKTRMIAMLAEEVRRLESEL